MFTVIFEGGSTIVINAVSQRNAALSSYGNIVDDIRCLVSSFLFFDFIHVHRTGNFVADALAKKAKNIVGCQVWLEELLKTLLLWPNLIFTSFCFLIYSRTLGLVSQKRKKKNGIYYLYITLFTGMDEKMKPITLYALGKTKIQIIKFK